MNPDDIQLQNLNKSFEYTKLAREIDTCNDTDELKNIAKCYVKLYLRTQETVASIGNILIMSDNICFQRFTMNFYCEHWMQT